VAPRVGVIYDLSGNGRTVAKVNYGFFGHNPGPGAAANSNPNQARKTLTYAWTDANGDRLFQFGEHGALRSDLTGPGGIAVDPDIRQPYTHEVVGFVEQAVRATMGVRAGLVYKTIDDQNVVYLPGLLPSAYDTPFSALDIGEDGRTGTADDVTRSYLGVRSPSADALRQIFTNVPAIGRFTTAEVSFNRRLSNRWSANTGFAYTWSREHLNVFAGNNVSPSVFPNSPNDTSLHDTTSWSFKASGSWDGPGGVRVSPVLRHQAGNNYGRTITLTPPAGIFCCGANAVNAVLVEPLDTRRMPNITVLDVRGEKSFGLGGRTRLRLFVDVFNIANDNAPETISFSTGAAFESPTAILGPRVARVGARFEW
jgi:hypothetical protein